MGHPNTLRENVYCTISFFIELLSGPGGGGKEDGSPTTLRDNVHSLFIMYGQSNLQ